MSLELDEHACADVPTTWCVLQCHTCDESWAVDTEEFEPELTTKDVVAMMTPILQKHQCS